MTPEERQWVWGSLAIVGGVGLVLATRQLAQPPDAGAPPSPGAAPNAGAGPRVIAPGARVLLIGDSLAQGLAPPLMQLARTDGVHLTARGRQSTTIAQWADQPWLAQALAEGPFALVLVSLGTNDMKLARPAAEAAALDRLLGRIRATGALVVWIAPPTMPFPDPGVRALVASTRVPTFPSETLSIPRSADGIHGSIAGYAGWAGALWRWLKT